MAFASLKDALDVSPPDPKGKRTYVESWCTAVPGFGIRVLKSGERCWVARYKKKGSKGDSKIRIDVAVENNKDSYELAQAKARELRTEAKGESEKGGSSLEDAYKRYELVKSLSEDKEWAPDTVKGYQRRINRLPKAIREAPMGSISTQTWTNVYASLITFETLEDGSQKKKDSVAKSMLRLVHAIYEREVIAERVKRNPVALLAKDVGLYMRKAYSGVYIKKEEMPRVWAGIQQLHPGVRDYLTCLLFLGWRKSVMGSLAWDNVDEKVHSYKVVRKQRGNKAKIQMVMPIPDALWELVFVPRQLTRAPDEKWVIPSHKKAGFPIHEPRGSIEALNKMLGLKKKKKLSPHPFRYTFITVASNLVGRPTALELAMHSGAVPRHEQQTEDYVMEKYNRCVEPVNRVAAEMLRLAGVSLGSAKAAVHEAAGPDLDYLGFM